MTLMEDIILTDALSNVLSPTPRAKTGSPYFLNKEIKRNINKRLVSFDSCMLTSALANMHLLLYFKSLSSFCNLALI